jgi:hypothetical protein
MAPLAGTALVLIFARTTNPIRAWQSAHAKTPHRESTELTRADASDYWSEENRHILTFSIDSPSTAYDPNLIVLRNAAELVLLCLQADRENRPLYGNLGHIPLTERDHPREIALLRDKRLFGSRTKVGGADAGWDRFVYVYTLGSASDYDFAAVLEPDEIAFIEANVNRRPEVVFSENSRSLKTP